MAWHEGQVCKYRKKKHFCCFLARKAEYRHLHLHFVDKYFLILPQQEWEAKAAKAKEDYESAVRDFEANGGSTENGSAKKRGKAGKKPAKKTKKAASDDDDDEEESE